MDDHYLSINFKVNPISGIDILIAELSFLNFEMFQEKDDELYAFIKNSDYTDSIFNNLRILKSNEFEISHKINVIKNINWNEQWEKNFDIVEIDKNCIIRAPFHKPSNKIYDIIINPEMSFGTGHHETTRLMAQSILEEDLNNKRLCDIGCGTGVLSIIAEKKGANEIDAVDIDIKCCKSSLKNIQRNSCKKINVIHNSVEMLIGNKYDFILSNITLNTIVKNLKYFQQISKPNTILIIRGFYNDDLNLISEKLKKFSFKMKEFKLLNNWVCAKYYHIQ